MRVNFFLPFASVVIALLVYDAFTAYMLLNNQRNVKASRDANSSSASSTDSSLSLQRDISELRSVVADLKRQQENMALPPAFMQRVESGGKSTVSGLGAAVPCKQSKAKNDIVSTIMEEKGSAEVSTVGFNSDSGQQGKQFFFIAAPHDYGGIGNTILNVAGAAAVAYCVSGTLIAPPFNPHFPSGQKLPFETVFDLTSLRHHINLAPLDVCKRANYVIGRSGLRVQARQFAHLIDESTEIIEVPRHDMMDHTFKCSHWTDFLDTLDTGGCVLLGSFNKWWKWARETSAQLRSGELKGHHVAGISQHVNVSNGDRSATVRTFIPESPMLALMNMQPSLFLKQMTARWNVDQLAVIHLRYEEFRCVVERRSSYLCYRSESNLAGIFSCVGRWVHLDVFVSRLQQLFQEHNVSKVYLSASTYTPVAIVRQLRLAFDVVAEHASDVYDNVDVVNMVEMQVQRSAKLFITDDCSSWAESVETFRLASNLSSFAMHDIFSKYTENFTLQDADSASMHFSSMHTPFDAENVMDHYFDSAQCRPLAAWSAAPNLLFGSLKIQVSEQVAAEDLFVAPVLAPEDVISCKGWRRPRKDGQGISHLKLFDSYRDNEASKGRLRPCNFTIPYKRSQVLESHRSRVLLSRKHNFIYVDALGGAAGEAVRRLLSNITILRNNGSWMHSTELGDADFNQSFVFSFAQDPLMRHLRVWHEQCFTADSAQCLDLQMSEENAIASPDAALGVMQQINGALLAGVDVAPAFRTQLYHLTPTTRSGHRVTPNFVGRVETFESDFRSVLRRIELEDEVAPSDSELVRNVILELDVRLRHPSFRKVLDGPPAGWGFALQKNLQLYPLVCELLAADYKCLGYCTEEVEQVFWCLQKMKN